LHGRGRLEDARVFPWGRIQNLSPRRREVWREVWRNAMNNENKDYTFGDDVGTE